MKNILIINLLGEEEVLSSGPVISSLKDNEDCHVTMLTYKSNAQVASLISNLDTIIGIDQKELNTLMNNKLFSSGFAFENLYSILKDLKNQKWHSVVNFSNDKTSTLISSYLADSTLQMVGAYFDQKKNVILKDEWTSFFNDSFSTNSNTPIHQVDYLGKMLGLNLPLKETQLKSSEHFNQKAQHQINEIKKLRSHHTAQIKIVAIDIAGLEKNSLITSESIVKILNDLNQNPLLVPMLVITHHFEARNIANNYNNLLNNELIIVEAGALALRSVLANTDLVLSSKSMIRNLAASINTSILDISDKKEEWYFNNGAYGEKVHILQNRSDSTTDINAESILATVFYLLSESKVVKPNFNEALALYSSSLDAMGLSYNFIAGEIETVQEMRKIATRQFIYALLDEQQIYEPAKPLKTFSHKDCAQWIQSEKERASEISADILGTIRDLLQFVEKRVGPKNFVNGLGKILSKLESPICLAQIPLKTFKNKLEAIPKRTFEENVKDVEFLLYELKADIQTVNQSLNQIEMGINSYKVEKVLSSKRSESLLSTL